MSGPLRLDFPNVANARARRIDRAKRAAQHLPWMDFVRIRSLPLGDVAHHSFYVRMAKRWDPYTHGYGMPAMMAAAIVGSGANGHAIALPQIACCAGGHRVYRGVLRSYELRSLYAFGFEIHARKFPTIVRTAAAIGFGLPYGRDGVVNSTAHVSRAYVETLLILTGRCTDELFVRSGKPVLSLLLRAYREGGREALRDKVQLMLDWHAPRYLDNIVQVLGWYERFVLAEINGSVDRGRHMAG